MWQMDCSWDIYKYILALTKRTVFWLGIFLDGTELGDLDGVFMKISIGGMRGVAEDSSF